MSLSVDDVAKALSMQSVDEYDVAREGEEENYVSGKDDVEAIGGIEHQDGLIYSVAI